MEIYLAAHHDDHGDPEFKAFRNELPAMEWAKEQTKESAKRYETKPEKYKTDYLYYASIHDIAQVWVEKIELK